MNQNQWWALMVQYLSNDPAYSAGTAGMNAATALGRVSGARAYVKGLRVSSWRAYS